MFSFKSDSSYPHEAPTYYRSDPQEQVKAVENLYSYFLNSDYSDEYYSDDEYSRDPDVDYTDTICYHPGISNRSSCASGAFHPGISPQSWKDQPTSSSGKSLVKQDPQNRSYPKPKDQPTSSSGKSLVKQDPQNRSYPKPRKARKKRHNKKHPKPSPLSPPVTGALCAQIKETQQLADHPPTHLPTYPPPSSWRSPINTKRGITRDHL
jgi:hypothetical protein